jgi:hypothetical protein
MSADELNRAADEAGIDPANLAAALELLEKTRCRRESLANDTRRLVLRRLAVAAGVMAFILPGLAVRFTAPGGSKTALLVCIGLAAFAAYFCVRVLRRTQR